MARAKKKRVPQDTEGGKSNSQTNLQSSERRPESGLSGKSSSGNGQGAVAVVRQADTELRERKSKNTRLRSSKDRDKDKTGSDEEKELIGVAAEGKTKVAAHSLRANRDATREAVMKQVMPFPKHTGRINTNLTNEMAASGYILTSIIHLVARSSLLLYFVGLLCFVVDTACMRILRQTVNSGCKSWSARVRLST